MASSPIKFEIPKECQVFPLFNHLPPELRLQIWTASFSTPGMSFVKLECVGRNWRWLSTRRFPGNLAELDPSEHDEIDEVAVEVKNETKPKRLIAMRLVPSVADPKADFSIFHDLNKQLRMLSMTCGESRDLVDRLLDKDGAVRMSNSTLLAVPGSSDILFLEYLSPELFECRGNYDINPNCRNLVDIRRVAMRYCHRWHKKDALTCWQCGLVHEAEESIAYPRHLYQFLSRHLPNLEEFYFVDYLLVRKATPDGATSGEFAFNQSGSSRKYKCGPRTYYEADDKNWNIKPEFLHLQAWLQDHFIRYSKASRLSCHSHPEKVRFGVLACETTIVPPVSLSAPPTPPAPKGHNKRLLCESHALRQHRRQVRRRRFQMPLPVTSSVVAANVPFIFGDPENWFEFTFEMEWRRL
ncbi:hypothetical protein BBK36DRAFT_1125289 [Trichoderma citrinoviride]|uniref:2EXR domain-containing protein n=1 Tax=Trichoderma citrinoviride TaxID=58853 RepID=A0A2T4B372_9HYPO|nr:hypothetical protein BBK36DRAFT_1125289 [Trichoderma citrinoviride]PTB63750.1 hypothetical protein BBK36DRAFT_1125289 [Trichoderma citrinoviride]